MPGVMAMAALTHARLDLLQESPEVALEFLDSHAAHYHSLGHDRTLAHMLAEQVYPSRRAGDVSGSVAKLVPIRIDELFDQIHDSIVM